MTSPEPITAPGIHDQPTEKAKAPFTQRQMKAIGTALTDSILAKVLLAVAGIQVPLLGKPFAFLAQWAHALQQRADDAYSGAIEAQSSANYANTQLLVINGGNLASGVVGGVAITEHFNGAAGTNLGANFVRTSSESGAGTYGPDGSGVAKWNTSGGYARTHMDRHVTPLATDYQVVMALYSAVAQAQFNGGFAYNWLRGRCNVTDNTYVYAKIGRGTLEVGCVVSGTPTIFVTMSTGTPAGAIWELYLGTEVDDYGFVVKCNGAEVWSDVDGGHVSQIGASYRYVGCGARAADRGNALIAHAGQTVPAQTDIFGAADRVDSFH